MTEPLTQGQIASLQDGWAKDGPMWQALEMARLSSLRQAEPVAWMITYKSGRIETTHESGYAKACIDDIADGQLNATVTPLYARPTAAPAGCVVVPESALKWLLGDEGNFECPPENYFRGKPPAYWWRSVFRKLISAAPCEGEKA